MSAKIVADSSCDLNEELRKGMNISIAPLTLQIDDKIYIDDKDIDIIELMKSMRNSKNTPKTACPSPQSFLDLYKGEESIFVVTLSSALSGTYRSAKLAKQMFLEEVGNKFIHVFDSMSASIGETLVSLKISELIKRKCAEIEIVEKVNTYIKEMKTFFILETLDNLVKTGRITNLAAKVSSALSIKPIMKEDKGHIKLHEKVLGAKRAFKRFVETIEEHGNNIEDKVLGIAHCNCIEKAIRFKEEVLKKYKFKDIIIVSTAGLSTVYANEGGLIIAF